MRYLNYNRPTPQEVQKVANQTKEEGKRVRRTPRRAVGEGQWEVR
jgi:hypothetical protein